MAEFRRRPVRRPDRRSWLTTTLATLGIVLAIAILKPWEDRAAGADAAAASPAASSPARQAAVPTPRTPRFGYDPRLFGIREPDPAWELWPAGYVVEFGIAGPVPVLGQDDPAPSELPLPGASIAPGGAGAPADEPYVVELGPADHLVALGINTPADIRVERIALWRLTDRSCCPEAVEILRLPTLWDSRHFLVVGVADADQPHVAGRWTPGRYRLELTTVTGDERVVLMSVAEPVEAVD
jgi:hypothetical protein